ncbi:hypothetical protein K437DRAFT_256520 [Tilletiaria anomala UBC 951]|uniref:DSC E3 ubiquitin ligase complex subunit 3 C-terminal domain-containing protein n=1 Tax=Tilletiaria anomala (strain ATCC 24038 / CBS 436.72 / UBC 951) TaxID=1037660 RepID=A0A066VZ79_TILAU|nr:uncharacterized protein K437DRAFT_256520 [Tilletiaria anomala UBC 951]KDN45598.1 hypothetical protein K437DRAFT_256520 [Tilletiaria anomala UBC 951]
MAQATIPALVAEKTNNGILKARRRIRPVTVRFTEPGIADLTTELVAETLYEIRQTRRQQGLEDTASVGYSTDIKRNGKARKVDAGVSDRADDDDDSSDSDSSSSTASTDTVRGASGRSNTTQNHHRPCITVLRSTDETVGSFRARIYQSHLPPDFQRRQVRLIHAGRILKDDGIKLVDWLDTLDEKRESSLLGIEGSSEQRPGAGAAATVNSRKDEQAREGEALVRELAKQGRRARKQALRTAKNIGGWIEDRATKALADVGAGPHSPLLPLSVPAKETHVLFDSDTLEDEIAKKKPENRPSRQTSKGKGRATEADMARWLQPSNLTVEESRASNTVYIQCSIGPEMDVDQIRQRKEEQTQAQQGRATLSWPSDNQEAFASGSTRQQYSGFDRLRETAGLNASDISTMRYHFRHARPELLLDRSGDVLRRAEEDEHARALEEQWIDGMVGAQNGRDDGGTAGSASGSQSSRTTLFGMMIGFFFPVVSADCVRRALAIVSAYSQRLGLPHRSCSAPAVLPIRQTASFMVPFDQLAPATDRLRFRGRRRR